MHMPILWLFVLAAILTAAGCGLMKAGERYQSVRRWEGAGWRMFVTGVVAGWAGLTLMGFAIVLDRVMT